MRTAGVFLIFAAVTLCGAGLFWGNDRFGAVMGFLAAYGLLLILKTWLVHRQLYQPRYAQAIDRCDPIAVVWQYHQCVAWEIPLPYSINQLENYKGFSASYVANQERPSRSAFSSFFSWCR